jgi:hypothetical protein
MKFLHTVLDFSILGAIVVLVLVIGAGVVGLMASLGIPALLAILVLENL